MKMSIINKVLTYIVIMGCLMIKPALGVSSGQLAACPTSPNCVSSQASDEKHFIEPLKFSGSELQLKEKLLAILNAEKRVNVVTSESSYISAEFTSSLFKFVDDVEFYWLADSENNWIIHVRSASRVGHSDFGANRKRVEKIRKQF